MSSYTPQFFGDDVADAQARVDAARGRINWATNAIKNSKSSVIKAAAKQALIEANDALIIAQNDLRLAKNPQAQSTVIDSSTGTTVSDIQKFYSQQPASTSAPASLQEAIILKEAIQPSARALSSSNYSWILKQAEAYKKLAAQPPVSVSSDSQPSTGAGKSKIPWVLVAGISFMAFKTFVLKH